MIPAQKQMVRCHMNITTIVNLSQHTLLQKKMKQKKKHYQKLLYVSKMAFKSHILNKIIQIKNYRSHATVTPSDSIKCTGQEHCV